MEKNIFDTLLYVTYSQNILLISTYLLFYINMMLFVSQLLMFVKLHINCILNKATLHNPLQKTLKNYQFFGASLIPTIIVQQLFTKHVCLYLLRITSQIMSIEN